MDTNPFATNPSMSPSGQTPGYLQPQSATTSVPGNISNMVKAIMAGNAQHQAQMQRQNATMGAPPINPTTTTGGPSVGAPTSLAPPAGGMAPMSPALPVDPSVMTGGTGGPMPPPMDASGPLPGMGGPAGPMAGMGMPQDPVAQALMSPIPGANMGSQFGG